MEQFVITKFQSAFLVQDPKGRRREFSQRRMAAFIVTVRGRIRFSYDGGTAIAEPGHPVFLPKGCTYLNECLEAAESYVFNFQVISDREVPMELSSVSERELCDCYEAIRGKVFSTSLSDDLMIMEKLYALSRQLLRQTDSARERHPMIARAQDFINQAYGRSDLTVEEIAHHCCISQVYLRKLFVRELATTPFRYLTELRMRHARLLLGEKRPIKEIAVSVGYEDVFQFSRAYRHHFGYPPSKER